MRLWIASFLIFTSVTLPIVAQEQNYTRKEDVIYGRKFGLAMTMDVFTPKKDANGKGLIFVVSGGFFSDKKNINSGFMKEFLDRGYTVFAVVHGSQPRFTIPEIVDDMHRSIRYIRTHAKDFKVDPDNLGIYGGSAGGHLSLMMGTSGNEGNAKASDPIERASSRVQAVACFFPPTDFLNYGESGTEALGGGKLSGFKAPFEFVELNPKTRSFDLITDSEKRREIGKKISPINFVTEKSAPTLIIHGDKDSLVPYQQAEIMIAKLKEVKVACELVTHKDGEHGWVGIDKDLKRFADWFDKYLLKEKR